MIGAGDPAARAVVVQTPRLTLRPFTRDLISDAYLSWLSDDVVNAHTRRLGKPPLSRADADAWLDALRDDEIAFMMFAAPFGAIGTIKYGPINWSNLACDVAILIGARDAWGNGYGSEAIYALSRHLFENRGVNRLSAASTNPGFVRAVESIGWRREGVQREEALIGGRFFDSILLSHLKRDFASIAAYEPASTSGGPK